MRGIIKCDNDDMMACITRNKKQIIQAQLRLGGVTRSPAFANSMLPGEADAQRLVFGKLRPPVQCFVAARGRVSGPLKNAQTGMSVLRIT